MTTQRHYKKTVMKNRFKKKNRFVGHISRLNVYHNKPQDIGGLKLEIESFVSNITAETCKAVVQNFFGRVWGCMLSHGALVAHMISSFKRP